MTDDLLPDESAGGRYDHVYPAGLPGHHMPLTFCACWPTVHRDGPDVVVTHR